MADSPVVLPEVAPGMRRFRALWQMQPPAPASRFGLQQSGR